MFYMLQTSTEFLVWTEIHFLLSTFLLQQFWVSNQLGVFSLPRQEAL